MNTIAGHNPTCFDNSFAATDSYRLNAARVSQTAVSAEQNTDITIMTEQGDRVTLSVDADFKSSYTTYSGLAANNHGYAKIEGRHFSFDLSLEQSIRVEGDLNEQELKDIKKVLKRLDRIIHKFLDGRLEKVARKAGKLLDDMKTIDSVEARVEVTQKAAAVDAQYVEATALSSFDGDRPAGRRPLPLEHSSEFNPIRELTDEMVDLVKESQVDPVKVTRFLDDFIQRLLANATRGGHANSDIANLTRLIQTDFFQKLQNLSAKEPKVPQDGQYPPITGDLDS